MDCKYPLESVGYVRSKAKQTVGLLGEQNKLHPRNNMEPQNGDLEDESPLQSGDFLVPCSFSGVYTRVS